MDRLNQEEKMNSKRDELDDKEKKEMSSFFRKWFDDNLNQTRFTHSKQLFIDKGLDDVLLWCDLMFGKFSGKNRGEIVDQVIGELLGMENSKKLQMNVKMFERKLKAMPLEQMLEMMDVNPEYAHEMKQFGFDSLSSVCESEDNGMILDDETMMEMGFENIGDRLKIMMIVDRWDTRPEVYRHVRRDDERVRRGELLEESGEFESAFGGRIGSTKGCQSHW